MKKKIDWLNHGLEFAVVLIGILIAFQLNNWSIKNDQQELINLHLDSIKEEVKFNKSGLKYSEQTAIKDLKNIEDLLQLIAEDAPVDSINNKTYELLNFGWLYLRSNAYNSLTESGDIRFIKEFKKRKSIVDLYEYFIWTEATNQIAYGSFAKHVQPYLMENMDYISAKALPRDVYKNKTFLNGLITYKYALKSKIDKLGDCRKKAEAFLKGI